VFLLSNIISVAGEPYNRRPGNGGNSISPNPVNLMAIAVQTGPVIGSRNKNNGHPAFRTPPFNP